ncbi:hypothetical protein FUT88_23130 [Ralstonia sp. TCR112]|uniref:hypothetical protein n=1 Tax=Ralstonia sp. TCR112 TaxID=2601730 RepID=UPI0011BF7415|nr:hypothetical protein [Ralstonia sp. TCR112]TXD55251.1 hypothetical protein FUT88_23130 [Ralstonia sp. TCR112]
MSGCYNSLSNDHLTVAFFEYFANNSQTHLKQNLYTGCQLTLADIAIDSHQKFEVGAELLYALLSDSREMVMEMAKLEPDHFVSARDNPLNPQFQVHMWQLAIQGDYSSLETKVDRLEKNGRKSERVTAAQRRDFFSLLMGADNPGLENLILKHADVPSQNALAEDYFSYVATLETKLCWYRGLPVEINHLMVPMDLMPIRPLDHYDDVYEFLKPGWVPPPQGLVGKLSRWFR